jgi:hypothetical protein
MNASTTATVSSTSVYTTPVFWERLWRSSGIQSVGLFIIAYVIYVTHFLTKRLPKVSTEMALNVLAYNMKRVMAILGVAGLLEALAA